MNMNAVGIDVSKGKSMVAILRPYGEIISKPFEVKHTVSGIRSLIEQIQSIDGESRIAVSYTHLAKVKRKNCSVRQWTITKAKNLSQGQIILP